MWYILSILFILSSVAILPNAVDNFWIPKDAVFLMGGFFLLGYNFISNKERTLIFKNKWIGLILIYLMLSFGWHFFLPILTAKAGQRVFWNVWNFLPTINVILGILLLKDFVEYTDGLNRWVAIARMLCWVGFGYSVYALLQFFGLDQIFTKDLKWSSPNHMITFMGNSMHSANFIAILSPLCLIFKGMRYKIFYALSFVILILINSTISMVGFIAGLTLYLLFTKRFKVLAWVGVALFVLGVLLWMYYPQYFSFSGRFELWKITLIAWKEKAITGLGLGGFGMKMYKDCTGSIAIACTNDYLQIIHDGGLILLILVFGYLANLFKRIIMAKDNILLVGYVSSFVAYLVVAGGSFIIWIAPMALIGLIYISAIETQV